MCIICYVCVMNQERLLPDVEQWIVQLGIDVFKRNDLEIQLGELEDIGY